MTIGDFAFQHPAYFTVLALPAIIGAVIIVLGVCGVSIERKP